MRGVYQNKYVLDSRNLQVIYKSRCNISLGTSVLDSRNLQVIYKGGVTDSRIFRMYKTMRR